MIQMGKDMHMGERTLLLLLFRRLVPALILLVIGIVVIGVQDRLVAGISGVMDTMGQVNAFADRGALEIVNSLGLILALLSIIVGGLGTLITFLQYRFFTFQLAEFDLRMKKGVFSIQEISIPYRQIQNVDITRSILYRLFGVSRLVVISAGHEDPTEKDETSTIFDPIDDTLGQEIRVQLERRIGVQVTESDDEADAEAKAAESNLPSRI